MKHRTIKWSFCGLNHMLERGAVQSRGVHIGFGLNGGVEIYAIASRGIAKTALAIPIGPALDEIIDVLTAAREAARNNISPVSRVRWEIDVDISDPVEAAKRAFEIVQRPGTTANCFTVFSSEGEIDHVDLENPNEEQA